MPLERYAHDCPCYIREFPVLRRGEGKTGHGMIRSSIAVSLVQNERLGVSQERKNVVSIGKVKVLGCVQNDSDAVGTCMHNGRDKKTLVSSHYSFLGPSTRLHMHSPYLGVQYRSEGIATLRRYAPRHAQCRCSPARAILSNVTAITHSMANLHA